MTQPVDHAHRVVAPMSVPQGCRRKSGSDLLANPGPRRYVELGQGVGKLTSMMRVGRAHPAPSRALWEGRLPRLRASMAWGGGGGSLCRMPGREKITSMHDAVCTAGAQPKRP